MPGTAGDILCGSYTASQPPSPFPCAGTIETKSHLTVIRLSDQEVYRFRPLVIDPIPGVGRCDGRVVFEYVDGPLPGSTLDIMGNDQLIDYDTLATFEPQNVRLTTRDGRIFELDLEEGVTLVQDLNGNDHQRPGPAGAAKLLAHIGAAPLFDGMGLILPIFSYAGQLAIGATSCREVMPDVDVFTSYLEDALDELAEAVDAPSS